MRRQISEGLVRDGIEERSKVGNDHTCDAEACLYASANARPKTRAPVKTTCVIMRWACDVVSMRGDTH